VASFTPLADLFSGKGHPVPIGYESVLAPNAVWELWNRTPAVQSVATSAKLVSLDLYDEVLSTEYAKLPPRKTNYERFVVLRRGTVVAYFN
jgi:hypothetical protein